MCVCVAYEQLMEPYASGLCLSSQSKVKREINRPILLRYEYRKNKIENFSATIIIARFFGGFFCNVRHLDALYYNSTRACRSHLFLNESYLNESGIKAAEEHLEQPYRTMI